MTEPTAPPRFTLRALPLPAKLVVTCFLMAVGLGYSSAMVQLHMQDSRSGKPMPTVGKGVEDFRVKEAGGAFRVIYTARVEDAIFVLHAFQKKSQATPKRDLETARERFAQLRRILP